MQSQRNSDQLATLDGLQDTPRDHPGDSVDCRGVSGIAGRPPNRGASNCASSSAARMRQIDCKKELATAGYHLII